MYTDNMGFEIVFLIWLALLLVLVGVAIRSFIKLRKLSSIASAGNKLLVLGLFTICCFAALLFVGYRELFASSPQIVSIDGLDYSQGMKGIWTDPVSSIVVNFDRPIIANDLQLELGPEQPGGWEVAPAEGFFPQLLGFKRRAIFTPERTAYPGKELQLYAVGLKSLSQQGDAGDKLFEIVLPGLDKGAVIMKAVEGGVSVSYPESISKLYEFELLVTDSNGRVIPLIQTRQGELNFQLEDKLNPSATLQQYRASLFASQVSRSSASGQIVERKPRELLDVLEFEMSAGSAVDFSKQLIWQEPANYTTLADLPQRLEFTYGSKLEISEAELKGRIVVEPKAEWEAVAQAQKLTLNFTRPLSFDTNYTVVILSGNSDSEAVVLNFRTPKEKFQLAVPLFKQELQFECNLTAASMLLNYYGHKVSKEQIFQGIPKDSTPFDPVKGIWGDPELGFVGDITGRTKGYGVHWQPVMEYISRFRPVQLKRNWNLAELLQTVKSGQPVMLWWQNGRSARDVLSWKTPAGKQIDAINGMHSEIVIGFEGGQESPEYILVNDPWRGFRRVHISEFTELWKLYSNTAIY